MKTNMVLYITRIAFLALLVCACSCGGGGGGTNPPANQPPVISSLNKWCPARVASGSYGMFGVNATDPDGDTLTYAYTISSGNIIQDSTSHPFWGAFFAPTVTADTTVTLTVTVTDGRGGSDTLTEQIDVAAPQAGNAAPVISAFTITPNPVQSEQEAVVNTTATDADGDELYYSYSWAGFTGGIASTGPGQATYYAPEATAEDTFLFMVYVDDGHGNFDSEMVNLTVAP